MVVEILYLAIVVMETERWVIVVDETHHSRSVACACKWVFEAVQKAENVENNLK